MRNVKAKIGAAAAVALAVVASAPATSSAEPPVPNVKYILTSDTGVGFQVNYLIAREIADAPTAPLWYTGSYFGDKFAAGQPKAPKP